MWFKTFNGEWNKNFIKIWNQWAEASLICVWLKKKSVVIWPSNYSVLVIILIKLQLLYPLAFFSIHGHNQDEHARLNNKAYNNKNNSSFQKFWQKYLEQSIKSRSNKLKLFYECCWPGRLHLCEAILADKQSIGS